MATSYIYSAVLIVPAASREDANRVACALGHDAAPLPGRTYSVELWNASNAVFFACRASITAEFMAVIQAAATTGELPSGAAWEDFGLTLTKVRNVVNNLIYDVRPYEQSEGHFDAVLADKGFTRWIDPNVQV